MTPVCWIDNAFEGGRITWYYREVPANLKVKKFLEFAPELKVFKDILIPQRLRFSQNIQSGEIESREAPEENGSPLNELLGVDAEQECSINCAGNLCLALTQGLAEHAQVTACKAMVYHAKIDETCQQ
jgi:hypothetical protein